MSGPIIGTSVLRVEDERLLGGRGRFLDDIEMPGTLHVGLVRSPHAHARIRGIAVARARALAGVVDVVTGADLAGVCKPMRLETSLPTYKATERSILTTDKARFVGDMVAAVVAETRYLAEDGIDLVDVDYEALPAVVDVEQALQPGAPLVHEELGDNVMYRGQFTAGDVDAAFASGERVVSDTFRSTRVAGVPLEPRGCLAAYDAGRAMLTVWTSTQIPHMVRTAIAELLDIPEPRVRVITPEVGGGFGTKAHVYPEEVLVAALAIRLGRPVKWTGDRREELSTSIHARDHVYHVDMVVTAEGIITAVRARVLTNSGAHSSIPFGCTLEPTGAARMLPGPYKIRSYQYETYAVATHTCPSGAYRGVAQPTCFLALEGMMDRVGRTLGIDPAEVRLRNLVQPHEFPYVNVVGVRYDTGSYVESLRRALEMVDYPGFRARQRASRAVAGPYRGIGICCFTEVSGTGAPGFRARGLNCVPGYDSAVIKVEPTGTVTAIVSHAAQGQGHETTIAQVVAQHLGVPFAAVTVLEGDTALGSYGSGTFASRSAITGGGAAILASSKVKQKMMRIAADALEASPEDVVIEDGRAFVRGAPHVGLTVRDVAQIAYSMTSRGLPAGEDYGLEANAYYDPPLVTMANAVHVAQVAVDGRTGAVVIERYVVVHDCGRIINPMIVNGQIHGGTAQGLGQALMEAMVYDDAGQLRSGTLVDYLLPTTMDMPSMEIAHIESPSIDTVGGFKGVGEGGVIGAVPAITNAVADALAHLGCNVNTLPLSPDRVLALIQSTAR
jgi:aerobic carbon-monoxide dehydrogenase large subunit